MQKRKAQGLVRSLLLSLYQPLPPAEPSSLAVAINPCLFSAPAAVPAGGCQGGGTAFS